jgi:hypothetical protein
MSYDIRLYRYSEEPISGQQLDDALDVLARYGAWRYEQANAFSVRWEDGCGLAIYSESLQKQSESFSALLVPLGNLSQRFCDFTHDFALATECAICPDVIPPLTVVVHSAMVARLPDAVTTKQKVIRASSGHTVRNALAESYSTWREGLLHAARQLNEHLRDVQ